LTTMPFSAARSNTPSRALAPPTTHVLSRVASTAGDGRVFVWDMNTRDCVHVFHDEGTLRSTALAASPDGAYFACASDMGVVNLYDASIHHEARPTPLRTLMNLTTQVDNLKFNHDG